MSSEILMNEKPIFFFNARRGEGDMMHYNLFEVQTKHELREAKFWGMRYEGERAIVYVNAMELDTPVVLRFVRKLLIEKGYIEDTNV